MKKEKLKPCPCCGGDAVITEFITEWMIFCSVCRLNVTRKAEVTVTVAWNKRIKK